MFACPSVDMKRFLVAVVNPRTSEEREITLGLTDEHFALMRRCEASEDLSIALGYSMPEGFMPIAGRIEPLQQ